MSKDTLVAGVAQQPTNTVTTRGLAGAARVVVVHTVGTVPLADVALASLKLPERLVLLWGQTVLLGYVRQPTGL